jgi:amidohydrolase
LGEIYFMTSVLSRDFEADLERELPGIIQLRHEFHRHPEIRFEERWTSDRISSFLAEIGIPHTRGHAKGTGIVAEIKGNGAKTIALRSDMDALEIQEESGVPYASEIPHRMHACGHDGHMAILCGAAKLLFKHRDQLQGTVKCIFQPAEELAAGGRYIVREGLLDDVDAAFALHAWPSVPLGKISIKSGPAMASADWFGIEIIGKGCHGADPGAGVDPIVIAAHIITALQTIPSREINPCDSSVVTVGRIQAGSTSNIIPETAFMEGTFRALDDQVRSQISTAIRRIAENIAVAHRAEARVSFGEEGYAPLINDPAMAALVRKTAEEDLGPDAAIEQRHPSMGAEDFAYYLRKVPGAMFFLGINEGETRPPLHSPRYLFNDKAITTGVRMMCAIAIRGLAIP